jgi:uncharacterized protein (DUF1501 family)
MNSPLSRRNLLKGAAALSLSTHASALARMNSYGFDEGHRTRSLVLVYLRGGADFLNMIIPRSDPTYEICRPTIGIKKDEMIELSRHWGLHPALKALKPIYDEGLLVPYTGVGSPHPTRSHFDAQDFMNYAAPGDRSVVNGWMNRFLTLTSKAEEADVNEFRAIGMQRLLPIAVRGSYPVLAVPDDFASRRATSVLDRFGKFYGADGEMQNDGEMDSRPEPTEGVDVLGSGKNTIESLRRFREIVSARKPEDFGYPRSSLGEGMQRIAQVILSGEGLEIAAIDFGGWDHHARQGGARGSQATKLNELGGALAAFRKQLGARIGETMVMVMTEFGRTVHENGSGGTDHGHGSGMFLMGGELKGGKVHGTFGNLRTNNLYQGRDLPVTTDFRDVVGSVLREHMELKLPKEFFPAYKPKKLKLFK